MGTPLAFLFFDSINGVEILVVLMAALMIYGSRLPEVALRAVAHVMRARRAVSKMWRDTGLEDELRRVRRDIELNVPRAADFDLTNPTETKRLNDARAAAEHAREVAQASRRDEPFDPDAEIDYDADPDADRTDEPFDSTVTIEPMEDAVARGDWDPSTVEGSGDGADEVVNPTLGEPEVERREPEGEFEDDLEAGDSDPDSASDRNREAS